MRNEELLRLKFYLKYKIVPVGLADIYTVIFRIFVGITDSWVPVKLKKSPQQVVIS